MSRRVLTLAKLCLPVAFSTGSLTLALAVASPALPGGVDTALVASTTVSSPDTERDDPALSRSPSLNALLVASSRRPTPSPSRTSTPAAAGSRTAGSQRLGASAPAVPTTSAFFHDQAENPSPGPVGTVLIRSGGTDQLGRSPSPTSSPTPSSTPAPSSTPTPTPTPTPSSTPTPTASGPFWGVLETDGSHSDSERQAGVNVAHLALAWGSYEPSRGVWDGGYVAQQQAKLASLRQAGFRVVLDAGLQYPAGWVFALPGNTRFVNQYGDVFHGSNVGDDIPNAVFDQNVRDAQAEYIARIGSDFGDSFFAIRVGGLGYSELRYPGPNYNGHSNSYWAFDGSAQAGSPVPGWVPGTPASAAQASAFYSYYAGRLRDYQNWQLATYRRSFTAWLEVLYPSWGLRPGDIEQATARNLDGSTNPASWGTLAMGLDWASQVQSITDPHVIVYQTWLERPDDGATLSTMSPVRYLQTLAAPKGLPVAGENAGGNSLSEMQATVARAKSLGLFGLMWMSERSLYGAGPTILQYGALIRA